VTLIARTPQLFLDLDGVLADFDTHCQTCFGVDMNRGGAEPKGIWDQIRDHPNFYAELPLMPGAIELYAAACALHPHPIILTGIPWSVEEAAQNKRDWVAEHIDPYAEVICCGSAMKVQHGKPGDVLVDDWARYESVWIEMGGVFILHRSVNETIVRLRELFVP
jgi:hypothetical protein